MRDDLPNLDAELARGEFGGVLAWLRENVHSPGCLHMPRDLVQVVTGKALSADPFMDYLETKFSDLYEFS